MCGNLTECILPFFVRLNAQNEAKVKKLGEEITSMKAAKVKLIKTMREESDKVINKSLYYIYTIE